MKVRCVACILVAVFATLMSSAAFASPVFTINGSTLDPAALNCSTVGVQTSCSGTNLSGTGFLLNSWQFTFDPDPSINGAFNLTNIGTTTQTFVLTVTLPTPVFPSPLLASGSIGAGLLVDVNGGGASLTDNGSAFYTALIDGASVHTLLDPPQSYVSIASPTGGPGAPVTIPFASFGPSPVSQPINTSIGIRTQFRLTSGDAVSLPVSFTVVPASVPEPSSLTLLGFGIVCLSFVRRRRSA
jgi:hypothetical protein